MDGDGGEGAAQGWEGGEGAPDRGVVVFLPVKRNTTSEQSSTLITHISPRTVARLA